MATRHDTVQRILEVGSDVIADVMVILDWRKLATMDDHDFIAMAERFGYIPHPEEPVSNFRTRVIEMIERVE